MIEKESGAILTLFHCCSVPLLIIASDRDIFFPADKVFAQAEKIFKGPITTMKIDSLHLPDDATMEEVCKKTAEFFSVRNF